MKSMKGKLLKKLKTIKPIGYLKPERFLQVNASDAYFEAPLPPKSTQIQLHSQKDTILIRERSLRETEPEIIDVTELMRDLEDEEIESDNGFNEKENIVPENWDKTREFSLSIGKSEALESRFWGNKIDPIQESGERDVESDDELNEKENIKPETRDKNRGFSVSILNPEKGKIEALESKFGGERNNPLSEIDVSKFRRPELNSGSLFDPNLLAAFEQAVKEFKAQEAERRAKIKEKEKDRSFIENENNEPPLKSQKLEEKKDPLLEFEEKCPPGGSNSVILYTTGLRSIRKTFEDCHSIRFLLQSFRVLFFERDISMHSEYREELWRVMGEKLVPPCLFIKGRYIGGAERVLSLHEQGNFRVLFDGLPIDRAEGPCDGCGGARFVVCFGCFGSNKILIFDDVAVSGSCPECNENGLIVCPLCC